MYDRDSIVKFGRHKGRVVEDIICGCTNDIKNFVVENYLTDLFKFLNGELQNHSIYTSDFILDKDFNDFITSNLLSGNVFSRLEIGSNQIVLLNNKLLNKKLIKFIENLLTGPYNIISSIDTKNVKHLYCSSLSIRPDTSYISWAIKTIDDFIVKPTFLSQSFECCSLVNIEVLSFEGTSTEQSIRIDANSRIKLFSYQPIIGTVNFSFSKDVIELNEIKLNNQHGSHRAEDDEPRYGGSFSQYGGPHINGSDLDDDYINDALDGDPNNQWNID